HVEDCPSILIAVVAAAQDGAGAGHVAVQAKQVMGEWGERIDRPKQTTRGVEEGCRRGDSVFLSHQYSCKSGHLAVPDYTALAAPCGSTEGAGFSGKMDRT